MKRKTKQNKTKKDDSLRQLFVCVPVVLFDSRFSFFSPHIYFFTLNGGRHLVSLFRLFHPRDLPRHGDKTYVDATREVKE